MAIPALLLFVYSIISSMFVYSIISAMFLYSVISAMFWPLLGCHQAKHAHTTLQCCI